MCQHLPPTTVHCIEHGLLVTTHYSRAQEVLDALAAERVDIERVQRLQVERMSESIGEVAELAKAFANLRFLSFGEDVVMTMDELSALLEQLKDMPALVNVCLTAEESYMEACREIRGGTNWIVYPTILHDLPDLEDTDVDNSVWSEEGSD